MFDPSAQYELSVCPRGRSPADEYYHQGQVWIEGREGNNYTLRFSNRSSERVLVVLSVDGLDVLKGHPAGHLSEGYVVNANSVVDVPGWKVDNNTAAEFVFGKVGKSYVTKMGHNANNSGVIGAMVFKELIQTSVSPLTFVSATPFYQPNYNPIWMTPTAGGTSTSSIARSYTPSSASINNMAIGAVSAAQGFNSNLGTGFGDSTQWNTQSTTFQRGAPSAIMALYYDNARGLQRRGIVLKSRYTSSTGTNPFPAYNNGGVPPPPGWTK